MSNSTATTDQEYYENSDNWGVDACVTLENIIDNIKLTADDDSYFKKLNRFRASILGKQGIKKLNVDLKSQNKAISIQLSASRIFPFPRYMTNWSIISVVNECGNIEPLNISNKPIVQDYLQDHDWQLLYDEAGSVLIGNCFSPEEGHCCYKVQGYNKNESDCECTESKFKDSWVKENRAGGYFEFSEDLVDELIVIEFQCAGLDALKDCDILVHNNLELTLEYYIKWRLLEGKRNTPQSDVLYYYERYKRERNRSKDLLQDKISINQILESVSLRYGN